VGLTPALAVSSGRLAAGRTVGHAGQVEEEQGIYGSEVMDIFGALADISNDTLNILAILRGDDEEDDEEEEVDT
jgi:hypothetical protein